MHLLLNSDLTFLSLPLERTVYLALLYSTLFWLPVRYLAARIDRRRATGALREDHGPRPGYRVGMDVLPPM